MGGWICFALGFENSRTKTGHERRRTAEMGHPGSPEEGQWIASYPTLDGLHHRPGMKRTPAEGRRRRSQGSGREVIGLWSTKS